MKARNKTDALSCTSPLNYSSQKRNLATRRNQLSFLLTSCLSAMAYANKSN